MPLRVSAILFGCFILVSFRGRSQAANGAVIDASSRNTLYPVSVTNLANGQTTATDANGLFTLPAKTGDVLSFTYIQYHTEQRYARTDSFMTVALYPLSVQLKEFILRPDFTPFQKDSIEMTETYKKVLDVKPIKPSFSGGSSDGVGGSVSGLIGSAVQKVSKSYKQSKRFQKQFRQDMEQKFIDTRYTQGLVTALTGFGGDTLAVFMNTYPMEYSFARTSTDLELKMWIRNNFREYMGKGGYKPILEMPPARQ